MSSLLIKAASLFLKKKKKKKLCFALAFLFFS